MQWDFISCSSAALPTGCSHVAETAEKLNSNLSRDLSPGWTEVNAVCCCASGTLPVCEQLLIV